MISSAGLMRFVVACALCQATMAWFCPPGYAGPDQCRGNHCDGNNVIQGRPDNSDCFGACLKEWKNDHWEFECISHGCMGLPCCNCWWYTGRRLAPEAVANSTAAEGHRRQLTPQLTGTMHV